MYQWTDDTLVAILLRHDGRCRVLELPARQTTILRSKRAFRDEEQAEAYINEQYPASVLRVQVEDIAEEVRLRSAQAAQQEQAE